MPSCCANTALPANWRKPTNATTRRTARGGNCLRNPSRPRSKTATGNAQLPAGHFRDGDVAWLCRDCFAHGLDARQVAELGLGSGAAAGRATFRNTRDDTCCALSGDNCGGLEHNPNPNPTTSAGSGHAWSRPLRAVFHAGRWRDVRAPPNVKTSVAFAYCGWAPPKKASLCCSNGAKCSYAHSEHERACWDRARSAATAATAATAASTAPPPPRTPGGGHGHHHACCHLDAVASEVASAPSRSAQTSRSSSAPPPP